MNIWIMNLKDNRAIKTKNSDKAKFDYCKANNIVGIGWVGSDAESSDDMGFLLANKYIDGFEIGDLVWTKNEQDEYYLCKIKSKAVKTDDEEINNNDISKYCKCEYIPVNSLPDGMDKQGITARHTIEKANDSVSNLTLSYFNCIDTEIINKQVSVNKKHFFKSVKAKIICVYFVLVVFIAFIIIYAANSNVQSQKSKSISTSSQKKETDTVSQEKNTSSVNDVSNDFPGAVEGEKLMRDYLYSAGVKFLDLKNINPLVTIFDEGVITRSEDNKSLIIAIGGTYRSAEIVYHVDSNSKWSWYIFFQSNYYDFDIFEALEALTQNCPQTSKPQISYLKQKLAEAGDDAYNWDHSIEVTHMGKRYRMCNDADGTTPKMIKIEPMN